jgi:transcription elongation factor Elf1
MGYKLPINPRRIPSLERLVRCLSCGHVEDFNRMKTAPAKRSFATDGRVVCSKCGAKGNCIEEQAPND